LVALALVAASYGGDEATGTTASAPLVATTEAPGTTAAPPTTVATFDLVAAASEYAATIPEGYMAVGDPTAFKDAVTAGNALVIDVREPGEYAEGHILDAINIPLRILAENLEKIPTDSQVFVYCKSGWRAGMATSSLRMLGYDNVLAYPPGWNGWTEAGEAISTGEVTAMTYEVPAIPPDMYSAVNDFLTTIPEGWRSYAGAASAGATAVVSWAFPSRCRQRGYCWSS